MITEIKYEGNLYILTNKTLKTHTTTGTIGGPSSDHYGYTAIICETKEEVETAISNHGFMPEEAYDDRPQNKTDVGRGFFRI